MAEALGVAASGIAIAQVTSQVGVAILKLKNLLDEVKDVPDDIADLMQQIDCLDPALLEAEDSFNDTGLPSVLWNDMAAKRSAVYCRNALKALTDLVDELSPQVNAPNRFTRKLASAKVVLKKPMLQKLEKRLENAVRMLMLAQQGYLVALTRIQPDIIIHKFTALTSHFQPSHINSSSGSLRDDYDDDSEDDDMQLKRSTEFRTTRAVPPQQLWRQRPMPFSLFGRFVISPSAQGSSIVIQAPSWLCRRSWDLQSLKANGSWQFSLRSYCARPRESKVFGVALFGSLQELQSMFDMGLASPFDYSSHSGNTLLHLAASNSQPMVLYLISKGLDVTATNLYGTPAVNEIVGSIKYGMSPAILEHPAIIDGIRTAREMDHPLGDQEYELSCTCQTAFTWPQFYMLLQSHQCPSHNRTTIESRLRRAWGKTFNPVVFKMILEPEWTSDLGALYRIAKDMNIQFFPHMNIMASGYYARQLANPLSWRYGNWCDWLMLSAELISGVSNIDLLCWDRLHYRSTHLTCMLSNLIEDINSSIWQQAWRKHIVHFLRTWVTSLKGQGVNLVRYGHLENQRLLDEDLAIRRDFFPCQEYLERHPEKRPRPSWKNMSVHLIGFKYGPEPEDWDIYWSEPTDEFAGDFWELIENPPPQIPGAWDDWFDD